MAGFGTAAGGVTAANVDEPFGWRTGPGAAVGGVGEEAGRWREWAGVVEGVEKWKEVAGACGAAEEDG